MLILKWKGNRLSLSNDTWPMRTTNKLVGAVIFQWPLHVIARKYSFSENLGQESMELYFHRLFQVVVQAKKVDRASQSIRNYLKASTISREGAFQVG